MEASRVETIEILGDQALTRNEGNDKNMLAVIYYDVKDQYGDSIKSNTSINWTISSSNSYTVDKNVGRITVRSSGKNGNNTGTDRNPFIYGTQISVTGVHAKTGKMVNKILTVGQEQAVDEVKPIGFLNKDKKKEKPTKDLPKDFQKDTYVLLYETLDQQGNPIEASSANISGSTDGNTPSYVTFVTETPEYITNDFKDDAIYTVDITDDKIDNPIEYSSVTIQPGMYVDRGGEATIKAIANRTGRSNLLTFNIGKAAMLQSVHLIAPNKTVADGDINVEIPYDARDTEGNPVTKYETLARSTNTLRMTASAGELVLKEQADGTGKFFWTDAKDYTDHDYDTTKVNIADGSDRIVALTTVVVGGVSDGDQTLLLDVSDMRRPTTVNEVSLVDTFAGATVKDDVVANNANDNSIVEGKSYRLGLDTMTYYDQYGEPMTTDVKKDWAKNFWKVAQEGKKIGGTNYGFEVEPLGNGSMGFTNKMQFTSETIASGSTGGLRPIYENGPDGKPVDKNKDGIIDERDAISWYDPNAGSSNSNNTTNNSSIVQYKLADALFGNVANTNELATNEVGSVTVKYSILAKASSDNVYSNAGKAKPVNYTIVPVKKVADFKVAVSSSKVGITTNNTPNRNGETLKATSASAILGSDDIADKYTGIAGDYANITHVANSKVKVSGAYKGANLVLPNKSVSKDDKIDCYDLPEDAASMEKLKSDVLCAINANRIVAITGSAIKWGDLYNFNTAKNERTDKSVMLTAHIYTDFDREVDNGKTTNKLAGSRTPIDIKDITKVSTSFKVSDEASGLSSVSIKDADIIPMDTRLALGNILFSKVEAKDQYDCVITEGLEAPEFTVSDYKENIDELAHLVDSSVVNQNGSGSVYIDGAEIGDTFTVKVSVKATASSVIRTATKSLKVAPDAYAMISSVGDNNIVKPEDNVPDYDAIKGKTKEEALRKTLKYDR